MKKLKIGRIKDIDSGLSKIEHIGYSQVVGTPVIGANSRKELFLFKKLLKGIRVKY